MRDSDATKEDTFSTLAELHGRQEYRTVGENTQ
jgi:hypothetical protein